MIVLDESKLSQSDDGSCHSLMMVLDESKLSQSDDGSCHSLMMVPVTV